MSHVLTSTSESYEKFLNNIIGKGGKKRSRDKFRPSHAARTIGGGMHMMLSSLSEHHLHHASGSSEGSPVSSPSPRGSSSRRTWHRKEKREKEKEKEKEKERDLKKTRKHSKKDGHHVEEMTTPTPASSETLSPPSFGRRLSLKLPRSPRGGGSSSEDGGEAAEAAPPRHANSSPQLPIPPHSASTATTSSSPSHHHLVSKLFSSTRRFSSAGKKEAHKDKWGTAEFTTTLQSGLDIEAERKKKEADDLRKKEEKEREDKRQQERERERCVCACARVRWCVISYSNSLADACQASSGSLALHLRALPATAGVLQRPHPQLPRAWHVLAPGALDQSVALINQAVSYSYACRPCATFVAIPDGTHARGTRA
jgi:hypothetical protein